MMTLVLTAVPAGLRGDVTKWLMEISAGVFVGNPSARVRDHLWLRVVESCKDGRAIMVCGADNEQGFEYRVHNHDWAPVDIDGLTLMHRPAARTPMGRRTGWSRANNQRRGLRPSWGGRPASPD